MTYDDIIYYLARRNLSIDDNIFIELKRLKRIAISEKNEPFANNLWCVEKIAGIQKLYLTMFKALKKVESSSFYEAWTLLERIDISLASLRKHYNYSGNKFNLGFIHKIIGEYEKLYPYRHFSSVENIIKKEECSICKKICTIRNHCEHKVGNLYWGEMCYRNVLDCELISVSIVENPFSKYAVIFPEGMEYNYFMLEFLMKNIELPYERWYINTEYRKHDNYDNTGRNEDCPCNSGKKYKKCCMLTGNDLFKHYEVILVDNPYVRPIPIIHGSTWK